MNKEAFKQVLKIVEKSARAKSGNDRVFDYGTWFEAGNHQSVAEIVKHPCGTFGCLGGWGAVLELAKTKDGLKCNVDISGGGSEMSEIYQLSIAARFYGITDEEADYLFYGDWHRLEFDAPTEDVLAKLRNIIETGKVRNPDFDASYQ